VTPRLGLLRSFGARKNAAADRSIPRDSPRCIRAPTGVYFWAIIRPLISSMIDRPCNWRSLFVRSSVAGARTRDPSICAGISAGISRFSRGTPKIARHVYRVTRGTRGDNGLHIPLPSPSSSLGISGVTGNTRAAAWQSSSDASSFHRVPIARRSLAGSRGILPARRFLRLEDLSAVRFQTFMGRFYFVVDPTSRGRI
jgi:hypothetical protein